ncbi:2TM domain-containing protein [Ottowia sp.]|uniref:2TM domain-containing protein n=1 Tax=Ottowia sp. TaxID=1898956 RepID=UPI0039E6DACF
MAHVQHTEDDRVERLARRRAGAKMRWCVHALVYLCVNAGLALIAWQTGRAWAAYPMAGWSLGLALHGVAVWLLGPAASLRERLVETEVRRLREREARR